jgi:CRISPR-associated endonuclease Csy4
MSMDHYLELRLRQDPEFLETVLMNALFAKLHRALCEAGQGAIGVSFPNADKNLGDKLRLHGSKEALERLMALNWLIGMRDHLSIFELRPVPANCQHRIVQRVQAKSSAERLYRRSARNGRLSESEAEKKTAAAKEKEKKALLKLPFVQLRSASTGEQFRLFIKQGAPMDRPQPGRFSDYGLSSTATVPWF